MRIIEVPNIRNSTNTSHNYIEDSPNCPIVNGANTSWVRAPATLKKSAGKINEDNEIWLIFLRLLFNNRFFISLHNNLQFCET